MTQVVKEARVQYLLHSGLRIIRMSRRNNRLANIAINGMLRILKEMYAESGEHYFIERSNGQRVRECAMWMAAELHRMAKDELPKK